ncbi:uncharacterized protein RMCC_4228 [Mycolicibacterium canariasense]|uniref:Uncharacterized protein n=1 Tax=Mycolicibacterium canariasense TaxID=228230 RepID=A0A117IB17_MYCCR|nr:hypothetical protein [Mycolicibacterium canariasense]MCV7211384.1 hypothetical protein [Mycolicibacterium canariasense]ORV03833.1 hypothetical protein AWB94_24050 [Mycolicibacterium canariasense]GAS97262.1 uncharacterized protein RMCC_4228 [Mycolicibacterium canariasense]
MYLSAERVAIVNHTIKEMFEQTCIAWQAIPHWDTGDPGQTKVVNDNPNLTNVPVVPASETVQVTVADLIAPTPDALLSRITDAVVQLAADVDEYVFPILRNAAAKVIDLAALAAAPDILNGLIDARVAVENAGFRAPASLFADTDTVKELYTLVSGYAPVKDPILDAGNVNALHRVDTLGDPAPAGAIAVNPNTNLVRAIVLGRRQRIAPGYAAEASPGEEPVDLAVSIPPSFEVIGDIAKNNMIEIVVRIRYAVRPKNGGGLVVISSP